MGNCQAADAAAVVIQHPGDGKVERLHWPATAADVMRRNPGHYVALVVLHHVSGGGVDPDPAVAGEGAGARITKVKLLKPRDTLHLGQVYRLITSQEVTKAVQTRRQERTRGFDEATEQERPRLHRRRQPPRPRSDNAATETNGEQRQPADHQERKRLEKDRHHRSIAAARGRGRHWRPALQSIIESSSSSGGHADCEDILSK
ncbi:hypothetical protein CFC21_021501 [Triticum aestivum]|uniref:Uncharacterized protein n=3 Tax=Triticum TaxID=4564 RepID=A0A9R1RHN9_TRITD|nr:uncharacterized protein LOC119367174 [Triticum dicoccoides]XP_044321918.1 uncharacterized protein LOC123043513 [Triticum aestivum]KAF7006459.1 hypothetical protein CFC21_021501 [Triticum aestivum]VAH41655.1 unnamed protein product [Triticum turgidum subsp. durum]